MKKNLPGGRFRLIFAAIAACLVIGIVLTFSSILDQSTIAGPKGETGTQEKMIVASGNIALDVDVNRLNGINSRPKTSSLRFTAVPDTFFTVLVFNNELRGPLPSSLELRPVDAPALPAGLTAAYRQLVIESLPWGGQYELAVRDSKSGFTFFNIEGQQFNYSPADRSLSIEGGRVLISSEFAAQLGRPADAGMVVGNLTVAANMRAVEITEIVAGEATSDVLPATGETGTVPGPDVIVGDLSGLASFGTAGTQVGLAVGTDSCNAGTENLHWFANPANDHPVIPQNLYRMSGGTNNDERFEQIGQSSVKHAFTALTNNICGFGCNGVGGPNLGSGCSDPYGASLNSGPSLGSRAWINPFTGAYPRNDSATPNNSHTNHNHTGVTHRVLTEMSDLNTTLNPGASYYAESQYVTPHEYVWCQANPGQCNMYNNVSYRKYNVTGTTSFSFSAAGSTVRMQPAIRAWPGATMVEVRPDPGNDGIVWVAYKVTNTAPGVWHYEYAIFNQNLDRGVASFAVPIGTGVTVTNAGFHAPPQHPGSTMDGTVNSSGYSSAPWTVVDNGGSFVWSTESFAANPNANAIRWGTTYNIRFDSNRPPMTTAATMGFFKTGAPKTVLIQGPSNAIVTCSRLPEATRCTG